MSDPKTNDPWQPIETAPKDGTWVLLTGGAIDYGWDGDTKPPAVVAQWTNAGAATPDGGAWLFARYDGGYYGQYENPTRWMALLEASRTF